MNQEQALNIIEATKNTYELIGSEFADTRNRVWPEMEQLVKKYVRKNDKVLDIGCGNGRLIELLPEVDYLGIDGSEVLLNELKNINRKLEVKSRKLDMLELGKLGENNFEVVFMFASFNHIPSDELRLKVLIDIKKLLKPGGLLIMTNWNMWQIKYKKSIWNYKIIIPLKNIINKNNWKLEIGNWKLRSRDIITLWQSGNKKKQGELYYRALTKRELKQLFKKSGFKILENYYSLDGKKSYWWRAKNIVTVGKFDK